MRSGTLSIGDVQKTCQISDKTAYAWRKGAKQKKLAKRQKGIQCFMEWDQSVDCLCHQATHG